MSAWEQRTEAPEAFYPAGTVTPMAAHWEPMSGWYEQWIESNPAGVPVALHYTFGTDSEVIVCAVRPVSPFDYSDPERFEEWEGAYGSVYSSEQPDGAYLIAYSLADGSPIVYVEQNESLA